MIRDWWLALDQGGHASRALVFDHAGRLIHQAFAPIHTRHDGDRVEHDAQELVQSLQQCLHDIHATLGTDVQRIAAAGLATQRSSIVCWHKHTGTALSPVLSWQDRRHHEWLATLQPQRQFIEQTTGLVLSAHYGASKLRWCLDHLSAVQNVLAEGNLCFGPLSSYLLFSLLAGKPLFVDPGNASRTQLWSPTTRDWSPELLGLFGIPSSALPRCVPTRHDYGHLLLGEHCIPLRVCTGDQAAVPYAQGALRFDSVYVNLGTGAFALAPLQQDLPDAAPLLRSVLWSDAEHLTYALEGTVNGAAAALNWYAEQFGKNVEHISRRLGRQQVSKLNLPLFINGVGGVGSPYWLPNLKSHFVPKQIANEPAPAVEQVAAVVESIAFLLTANLTLMQRQVPTLSRIVVGGGLSQCQYLCESLADLNDLIVTRPDERELTAKGLAYLIASQPDENDWIIDGGHTSFSPQHNDKLFARYRRWQKAMLLT